MYVGYMEIFGDGVYSGELERGDFGRFPVECGTGTRKVDIQSVCVGGHHTNAPKDTLLVRENKRFRGISG